MTVYLDNCCFNRPYDDQVQARVRLEAEATLFIQEAIRTQRIGLVWSWVLDVENGRNPNPARRAEIALWKALATVSVAQEPHQRAIAENLQTRGAGPGDSLHLACAIEGKSEYFLTVDDGILKRASRIPEVRVVNPLEFLRLLQEAGQ